MAESAYFIGVDLGGTRLRLGAVARDGRLASEVLSVPTGSGFRPDDLSRHLAELTRRLKAQLAGEAAALGFGTAGVVDHGPLTQCDNLPLLNGVDIGALVRSAVDERVAVENDARCFTLAEARYGAGRGVADVCGITLGTGVGCGVMLAGRLHRGAASQAGEVWQIPLRGEPIEAFLSGAGVVRGYAAAGGRAEPPLEAEHVAARARGGDAAAGLAWQAFGADLGWLCRCLISVLDPARIVIGGSLSLARELYGPALAATLGAEAVRIADAALGASAGVIGAAALNIDA